MDSSIGSPCEFCAGNVLRLARWRIPRKPIALAGVLSGALILLFCAVLIHLLLLRRRAKQQARASRRLIALDGHGASSSSSSSQSDSDLGSLEAAEGIEEKGSRLSLNLTPNQPIFVDVDAGGAHAGLQLLLTPPTPRRAAATANRDSIP
ncbi:hypothetical protein EI94DRAFT_1802897 [Lactarius quietus]|nr:hypothetical protein EI94DRAFT_1802897 [Lactarius quietus]